MCYSRYMLRACGAIISVSRVGAFGVNAPIEKFCKDAQRCEALGSLLSPHSAKVCIPH